MKKITNYDKDQSPTGLGIRDTRAYEAGRKELGGTQRISDKRIDRSDVIRIGKKERRSKAEQRVVAGIVGLALATGVVKVAGPVIDKGFSAEDQNPQPGQIIPENPDEAKLRTHPNVIVSVDGKPVPTVPNTLPEIDK